HAGDVGPLPGEPRPLPPPRELPLRRPDGHRPRRRRRPGAVPRRQGPGAGRAGRPGRPERMVHPGPVSTTTAQTAPVEPGQRPGRTIPPALATGDAPLSSAPAAVLFGFFVLYPLVPAVTSSMSPWGATNQEELVGLAHSVHLFTAEPYRSSLP